MEMKKENVYEQDTQAEAVACATGQNNKECEAKEASAVLGKFKDVSALVRAYEQLEAEFTRRSQKLKRLEKEVENFAALQSETGNRSGVEKLRENALQRKEEALKFDRFLADIQTANACAAAETQAYLNAKPTDDSSTQQNGVGADTPSMQTAGPESAVASNQTQDAILEKENASVKEKACVASVAEYAKSVPLSQEELFEKANADESVRLKIIGEYLSSIGKTAAPLMQGGTGTLAVPPKRPKSFDEAGSMALHYFKKEGAQA